MLQRERASAIQPIMESEFDSPAKAEKEEPWSWGKKKKKHVRAHTEADCKARHNAKTML